MFTKRLWNTRTLAVFTLALLAVLIGAALSARPSGATPGEGVTSEPLASGNLADPVRAKFKDWFKVDTDVSQVRVVRFTVTPGGYFGWHQHGGPVWAVIVSGTLTYYSGDDPACTPVTYPAGSTFMDPGNHTHNARNEGSEDVVVYATFMLPEGGAVRIDMPAPGNCPF